MLDIINTATVVGSVLRSRPLHSWATPCVAGLKFNKEVVAYLHVCYVIIALWACLTKQDFSSAILIHQEAVLNLLTPWKRNRQRETSSSAPDWILNIPHKVCCFHNRLLLSGSGGQLRTPKIIDCSVIRPSSVASLSIGLYKGIPFQ